MKGQKEENMKKSTKVDPKMMVIECGTLPNETVGKIIQLPKYNMIVGVDPRNNKVPIQMIVKKDGSLQFFLTSEGPLARIKIADGLITMTIRGVNVYKYQEKLSKINLVKVIDWTDSKSLASTLGQLAYRDSTFQNSIKFADASISTLISVLSGECSPLLYHPSWWPPFVERVADLSDCEEIFIPPVVEYVNKLAECLQDAWDDYCDCWDDCDWWKPWCYVGCTNRFLADQTWCFANSIIEVIIEAAKTITQCVTKSGALRVDEEVKTGDIIVFAADSAIGHAIDQATCGHGYSHVGLICGNDIIEATGDGVIEHPFSNVSSREHKAVRLDLTANQISDLCECVRSKIGSDYDYLEAMTFGTIDNPGKEICTMLIMHCLDEIGIDRDALGLSGFVSPNDIARAFGLPRT